MTVLDRFLQRDIRALSKVVSFVENRDDGYRELLGRLYPRAGHTVRVGITGPPGAGKSTLVNLLARQYLDENKTVGIIAVDPTSPFSGGALLGDRVRMNEMPTDGTIFFRSMATRGASGGLAGATDNVAVVYDAFGFDITLIETVGVGQVELDIIDSCDTVVVVLVPESGDAVQTMKAGLMEIADVFCVNKADRPGAERMAADLKHTLETKKKSEGDWAVPIVSTVAVGNKNVDRLKHTISEHLTFLQTNGQFEQHRRSQLKKKILNILKNRFQREFLERLDPETGLEPLVGEILSGATNPFEVGDRLYERFLPSAGK
jgi:LAO/AO transport system kinase